MFPDGTSAADAEAALEQLPPGVVSELRALFGALKDFEASGDADPDAVALRVRCASLRALVCFEQERVLSAQFCTGMHICVFALLSRAHDPGAKHPTAPLAAFPLSPSLSCPCAVHGAERPHGAAVGPR